MPFWNRSRLVSKKDLDSTFQKAREGKADLKGAKQDEQLPMDVRLGDHQFLFKEGSWTLLEKGGEQPSLSSYRKLEKKVQDFASTVSKLQIDLSDRDRRVEQLQNALDRATSNAAAASSSSSAAAAAAAAAASSSSLSATDRRRISELETENARLQWQQKLLIAMLTVWDAEKHMLLGEAGIQHDDDKSPGF